jgi:Protein of unknown function (DUF3309)
MHYAVRESGGPQFRGFAAGEFRKRPDGSSFGVRVVLAREVYRMLRTILLILVVLMLLGSLPLYPYSAGWGYYPSGGLGLILVILIIWVLMDRRAV